MKKEGQTGSRNGENGFTTLTGNETEAKPELGSKSRSLLDRLRQGLSLLSPAEKQNGTYVLDKPREVLRLPMDQLAREIGISAGTLANFCQTFGFSGFKDFRLSLAAEVNSPIQLEHSFVNRGDTLQDIANKAISANLDALISTLRGLDLNDVQRAIDVILKARTIELYALGVASAVAHDAFGRLKGIGLLVNWLPDTSHQLTSAVLLTPQDVVIAFSNAGETRSTLKALKIAKQNGATLITFTGNPHSSFAQVADISFVVTPREPTAFSRNLRISARTAMLGLMDVIYLGLLNSIDDTRFEQLEQIFNMWYSIDSPRDL
jgi:RpiR family transcriptional regulator, carbohydrate utilization regulator